LSNNNEDNRIYLVKVKFDNKIKNTNGKSSYLKITDIEARRYREQTRLETLVVYTVNDEYKKN